MIWIPSIDADLIEDPVCFELHLILFSIALEDHGFSSSFGMVPKFLLMDSMPDTMEL